MKKWFLVLVLLLAVAVFIPGLAPGQVINWYPANQATVAWDPVTTLSNGSPIPVGSTVQYVLYSKTPTNPTPKQEGQPVSTTQTVVTFAVEGQYFVGVKSQRLVGGVVVSESATISWSDNPTVVPAGGTWGIQFYLGPGDVGNLRRE